MSMPAEVHTIPSDLSDRTLTLSLNVTRTGPISLRSCEVIGKTFRNRISFQEQIPFEEVLVARLARAIRACLEQVPQGTRVLSLPEFVVELPGLALSGLHLMIMDANGGVRSAILRFKEFMGAINKAFKTEIGFHEPYPKHGEKLAINVLEDICMPILNLCREFDAAGQGANPAAADRLADRALEFQFQTELLKRYIYNASIGHADPDDREQYALVAPDRLSIAD